MKNEKGVTLVSLTIYVIVAGIVIVLLSFLNANFFSRIADLTNRTNVTNEYSKFCSAFIRDLKSSDSVLEYNQNELRLSNGVVYEIRKQTTNSNGDETYAIYKDSIKVCENIKPKRINISDVNGNEVAEYVRTPYFAYDHLKNTVTVLLTFSKPQTDSYEFDLKQIFKVGY